MAQLFKSVISGLARYLPEKRVTNDDLAQFMDTNDKWVSERTGIKERRFADEKLKTSDLAVGAVQELLQKTGLKPSDFDYIIATTISPDYYFPGIAPLLQTRLGFPCIPSLDVRVQCSAFVYSTQLADAFIRAGQYKRILVVGADLQTKLLDLSNRGRNVAVLFGDGAAAAVFEAVPCNSVDEMPTATNNVTGVIDTHLGADGMGAELLLLSSPGTATEKFLQHEDIEEGRCSIRMEGQMVFKNAINRMCETAEILLARNHISAQQLDLVVPHQANMRISEMVREKLKLPPEKFFNNIHKYGNTTSATIPLGLYEAQEENKLKPGSLVLTVAFGAGFTWGGSLIRF